MTETSANRCDCCTVKPGDIHLIKHMLPAPLIKGDLNQYSDVWTNVSHRFQSTFMKATPLMILAKRCGVWYAHDVAALSWLSARLIVDPEARMTPVASVRLKYMRHV